MSTEPRADPHRPPVGGSGSEVSPGDLRQGGLRPARRKPATASAWSSPSPAPAGAWRHQPSNRRTGSATGNRSVPRQRAPGRPRSGRCPGRGATQRARACERLLGGVMRRPVVINQSPPARIGHQTLEVTGLARRGPVTDLDAAPRRCLLDHGPIHRVTKTPSGDRPQATAPGRPRLVVDPCQPTALSLALAPDQDLRANGQQDLPVGGHQISRLTDTSSPGGRTPNLQ